MTPVREHDVERDHRNRGALRSSISTPIRHIAGRAPRRPAIATTSSAPSGSPGSASRISPPRRIRSTNSRLRREGLLEIADRLADEPAHRRADRRGCPTRGRPRRRVVPCDPSERDLELASFRLSGLQVHAQQPGREARQKPDDEGRADEVGDRVGHRDVVQQPRLLGRRQVEPSIVSPAVPMTVDSVKAPAISPAAVPLS